MFPLGHIGAFLAAFVRCAAWAHSAPLVGDALMPRRLRVAVAAFLAVPMLSLRPTVDLAALPSILPSELALGLIAGFSIRLALAGIEAGGQLIGLQLELGFASMFDPATHQETLPTNRMASCIAGLTFLSLGGLETTLRSLATPVVRADTLSRMMTNLMFTSGEVILVAVRVAMPIIAAGLAANLTCAVANRAAPALNVFSVMLALVLTVGGLILVASAPSFTREVLLAARAASQAVDRVALP